MYKIIGADQKEYGPVTFDQINAWIREGRANGQTLAQTAGSDEWKWLASFPEFALLLTAAQSVPPRVEGPMVTADIVLARGIEINIADCLRRGWKLLLNNPALFLGASFVLLLIQYGLGWLPVVGSFVYLVISGALHGGFYLVFLRRMRGEPTGIGDLFAGFGPRFVQFMLAGIVTSFLTIIGIFLCCFLPGIYLSVAWWFTIVLVADRQLDFWPAMELSRKVITRQWFRILALLLLSYLPFLLFIIYSVFRAMTVAFSIIAKSGGPLDFSQITKAAGELGGLSLIQQGIAMFTLPFATAVLMCAYEDLFGTRPAQTA